MVMFVPTLVALFLSALVSAGPGVVPPKTGTCWAMGDPHYRTFDGHYYNFMGNCTYTMAKNCKVDESHPAFEVEAQNKNRANSQLTGVAVVTIKVYGITINIFNSDFGYVRVNYSLWSLPISLANGKVKLTQSGFSVLLETDFGLMVEYNWQQYLALTVPGSLAGRVCGMCGNFNNNDQDDLITSSGSLATNVEALGESWRVPGTAGDTYCQEKCTGQCENCESAIVKKLEDEMFCKYFSDTMAGPFEDCQTVIDPRIYYNNCIYDMCRGESMKTYMCDTLEVYGVACQRAGVKVQNWRATAHCPLPVCPQNSHFEQCGSPCTASCENPNAPSTCKDSCVQTCTCDEGFLRSGNKCVPKSQCGCEYNGFYVEAGATFWGDDNCSKLCHCSLTGGKVETQETSCPLGQQCQVVNGIRGCHSLSNAICMVSGDPHYLTFDGQRYNFQGTCVYQMAIVCSDNKELEPFGVVVQNDGRDKNIGSVTNMVTVNVYGYAIVISKEYPGLVMINGELSNLPVTLDNNKLQVYKSSWFAVVESDFGVKVAYDWSSVAYIIVPITYSGAMCGMCGNFNLQPDDDMHMKEGNQAVSSEELGESWRVATFPGCVQGCKGPCPDCDITQRDLYATNKYCGIINDPTGPFRDCHSVVDPAGFFQDCLFDVCLYQGRRNMQCKTLRAYTVVCQEKGATVFSWRSSNFCAAQCPVNSNYQVCASGCPISCQTLSTPSGCQGPCKEGCVCDDGFYLSGDLCVPLAQCGCLYQGLYYKNGQVFYPNGLCQQECTCNSTVTCVEFTCGPSEKCDVKNGVRSCLPVGQGVCSISGDPHYKTFDNVTYDFQGTCTYTAAQACHLEGTQLTPFTVVVENEKWDAMSSDPKVSVAKLVVVEVYGNTLTLRRNQIGMVMLNGVLFNLPLTVLNGAVQVYQDGTYDVIVTDFGLRVTYDLVYHVTITVPGNYHGKTCGLCGNYNDNNEDDFLLPDGKATKDLLTLGAAWKVGVPGVVCDDGCSGDLCPKCDKTRKPVIEKDCSIITDPDGPFAVCHNVIDPASYFRDCVFDVCMVEGDRDMLCHSINAYMVDCQDSGVEILTWRTPTFCPFSCPANSHYHVCSKICDTPCPGLTDIISCPPDCAEGCACNPGYHFNGTGCVELDQCGCYSDGHTLKMGESMIADDCFGVYTCHASGVLFQTMSCKNKERCRVQNGVSGCYPEQCLIDAGGVFTPFNGQSGRLTASGSYEIVKMCDQSMVADWYKVVVTLHQHEKTGVLSVVALYVVFDGLTIHVNDKQETWVNDKKVTLPSSMKNNISVKLSDNTLLIEKQGGLRVSYGLSQGIAVTVGDSMENMLCGACGRLFFTESFIQDSRSRILNALLQNRALTYTQQYMSDWKASDYPQQ